MPWQHHGSTSYQDPRRPKPIILTMILMVPLMAACPMNIDHDASEEEPISFRRDFGPPFDLGFRRQAPGGGQIAPMTDGHGEPV